MPGSFAVFFCLHSYPEYLQGHNYLQEARKHDSAVCLREQGNCFDNSWLSPLLSSLLRESNVFRSFVLLDLFPFSFGAQFRLLVSFISSPLVFHRKSILCASVIYMFYERKLYQISLEDIVFLLPIIRRIILLMIYYK